MAIESDEVVKSVGRVFEVLELFDEHQGPLTATQVERSLGFPQSSTLALLKSMVRLGYLSFDRMGRQYLPTLRVATLGRWLERSFQSEGRLRALLDEVRQATGETVCISCQNDLHMQLLQVELGIHPLIFSIPRGMIIPLFQSAIGLTALSGLSDAEITRMAQRLNRRTRKRELKVNLELALKQIDKVRTRGYCVGYGMSVKGIGAIAFLIPSEDRAQPIVLSVAGPTDRIAPNEAEIVAHAQSAVEKYLRRG
ncbi:MAG: IclR family transcriptional regulator [Steroidobacteraceae bacterium]|nr:IclR family transcriptional regulator [Steroidobacteraceae bacterium]